MPRYTLRSKVKETKPMIGVNFMPLPTKAPLCGAKARTRGGAPCLNITMANGRCFLHGGKALLKHGKRSNKAICMRKEKMLIRKEVRKISFSILDLF